MKMGILHQVQGEDFSALAALIFLLQIARARRLKIESLPDGSVSGDTPHYFVDGQHPGLHTLVLEYRPVLGRELLASRGRNLKPYTSSYSPGSGKNDRVMELYRLHMMAHPPKFPNGPATYTLIIAREASPSGSIQSANFPSWDSLARKLASVEVDDGELQKAKRELDVNRYYRITGVSLSPPQIELLGFIPKPAPTPR